jgi:glutamate/tyrosine decarboxylase-like PLP-dependent enzyme
MFVNCSYSGLLIVQYFSTVTNMSDTDLLRRTAEHATRYLADLPHAPVSPTATLQQLRDRLQRDMPANGMDAAQLIDDLVRDIADGLMASSGGRFFGWVIGGTLPAALAADWLTSTWDQNAAIHVCSPVEAVIEEVCGVWLKQLLLLPNTASFGLTTGSQMAHLVALASARHALLARRGWDVEKQGIDGAPRLRIITSDQHHGSLPRAVRLLGLGLASINTLPTNSSGRLEPSHLAHALEEDTNRPTIVVLQAGDLNIGAFDQFSELIPLAHDHGAWVHVDGAFGLWVAASDHLRPLVAGVEDADSWVTDGHKWLNVPYDCGYVFVADAASHFASMSHRENYLMHIEGARDQIDWNPEWSRRGRGAATYAALRQLGGNGVAELVERCCQHARELVEGIGTLPNSEIVWSPQVNQGLVRFIDPQPGATDADHDRYTDAVIAAINASGEAFFGGTTWRGRRCMRVSVCSWRTTSDDIKHTISCVKHVIAQIERRKTTSQVT